MKYNENKSNIRYLVFLSLLAALVYLFSYTQLIKFGTIEISLCTIPVALGAIVLGPTAGGVLGGVFGLLSFLQCFGAVPGLPVSVFGSFILGISPSFTFLLCFVPRILMGVLVGWIFKGLFKVDKTKFLSYLVANVSSALLNTLFFVGMTIILFWSNATFVETMAGYGLNTDNIALFFIAFVGTNGLIEAIVCAVLGTAVSKGVHSALLKTNKI